MKLQDLQAILDQKGMQEHVGSLVVLDSKDRQVGKEKKDLEDLQVGKGLLAKEVGYVGKWTLWTISVTNLTNVIVTARFHITILTLNLS